MWDIYEKYGGAERSTRPIEQQRLFAVLDLRYEVNAVGFDFYFRYSCGDTAESALTVLPDLLGTEWADLLREAMAVLGPVYPSNGRAREEILDALDLGALLDEFDERFFALERSGDADSRLAAC